MKKEQLIRKYERSIERAKKQVAMLEEKKQRLSVHGGWALGYQQARITYLENVIDDLLELDSEK